MSTDQCCKILRSVGFDQATTLKMVNLIEKWVANNGPEWTVNRLKQLKQDFIMLRAGHHKVSTWISYTREGVPRGPFGKVFKLGLRSKTARNVARAIVALTSYHRFVANQVTRAQRAKFVGSMVSSKARNLDALRTGSWKAFESLVRYYQQAQGKFMGQRRWEFSPWYDFKASPNRRVPLFFQKGGTTEDDVGTWLLDHFKGAAVLLMNDWEDDPFFKFMSSLVPEEEWPDEPRVGRVSCIQETGYKLRAVANPNRILQLYLEPLKNAILDVLAKDPSDCTFKQEQGVVWAYQQIKSGKEMYCFDISDATNNFSLDAQAAILTNLFPQYFKEIILFSRASIAEWDCGPELDKSLKLRFNVGQPLGLGPSFGAMALMHHFIMNEAMYRVYADPKLGADAKQRVEYLRQLKNAYRILGDDVVISNKKLAMRYKEVLSEWNIPISQSKSIEGSNKLCEFAGHIIMPCGVVPSYKWRSSSDNNFLDLAKALGFGSQRLFRKLQSKVIEILKEIPEKYQGLGWNPNGVKLFSRLRENIDVIRCLQQKGPQPYHAVAQVFYDACVHAAAAAGAGVTIPEDLYLQIAAVLPRPEEAAVLKEWINAYHKIPSDISEVDLEQYRLGSVSDPRGPAKLAVILSKLLLGSSNEKVLNKLRQVGLVDDNLNVVDKVDRYVRSKLQQDANPVVKVPTTVTPKPQYAPSKKKASRKGRHM